MEQEVFSKLQDSYLVFLFTPTIGFGGTVYILTMVQLDFGGIETKQFSPEN